MLQVILLIYEYAIAVEWTSVQIKRTNDASNSTNDSPFADRLDRTYFGFDQDYFERMPLLVNALQESNYIDPLLEMSRPTNRKRYNKSTTTIKPHFTTDIYRQSKIRRTSPRPFIFEYRSPTPLPFSKTYGSRSWVDSYRNAQRLQNIRQVIKYLEKTINAKMGDVYSKPSTSHTSIAFSEFYVEPLVDKNRIKDHQPQNFDMQQQNSDQVESFYTNHQSDPLFNFKPNNPGDVNLLADGLWRFAPIPSLSTVKKKLPAVSMFKKISNNKTFCSSTNCNDNNEEINSNIADLLQSSAEHSIETPPSKPKSYSVMVNLFPYKPNPGSEFKPQELQTQLPVEKIYLTTAKPVRFQFRRKSNLPARHNYYRYKKPKYLIQKKNEFEERFKARNMEKTTTQTSDFAEANKMIVQVNVYSPEEKTDMKKKTEFVTESTTTTTTHGSTLKSLTDLPFEISSGKVEDFHDGSSGVILVQEITETPIPSPPVIPQVTTLIPFFDTNTNSEVASNLWPTNPPQVIQFGAEDAKVPHQYLNLMDTTTEFPVTEINRRTSLDSFLEEEHDTLIIRLKNDVTSTSTTETVTETSTEEVEETTTRAYVPQTNGHARSFYSRNASRNIERNRKKKLEMSVTGFRTYVPMYVEIKRNKTIAIKEDDD